MKHIAKDKGQHVERSVDTTFHDTQAKFALDPEAERMDQYAKPGTTAAKGQSPMFETSFPTSRYRSRNP